MGESFKAMCVLVLIVAALVAAVAWIDEQPSSTTWIVRIGMPLLAVLALAVVLKLHFRTDLVPDYLRAAMGDYFNRDGFCFAFKATAVEGVAYLNVFFQNQYDQPCRGRIAIRPARGFWMTRPEIPTVALEIDCSPAAYGVAKVAMPLMPEILGKKQRFEVGASVDYAQGNRHRLRFRDGVFLRANSEFGNAFATAVSVTGVLCGNVVLSSPATATIAIPTDVTQELPQGNRPSITTLWKLGDPPLANPGDAEPSP
jgi:hypothetical protein